MTPGSTSLSVPLNHLEGVGRRYRVGERDVVALANLSFDAYAEEFVVVLGPSGSGKTTLLNMIGALDSPPEGRVVVAGRDGGLPEKAPRQRAPWGRVSPFGARL
jgi:putative ABC transport system ATP-binding protein